MIATQPSTITIEAFLAQPNIDESPAWELLGQGEQQKLMPTIEHSWLQLQLANRINAAESQYVAIPELRCNVGGLSSVPDLAVIANSRLPETGHFNAAPNWVIEIRSPDQSTVALQAKILHLLQWGTELAWLIDLQRSRVMVWANGELDILSREAIPPSLAVLQLSVIAILQLAQRR
ncbi:MAG: Uma2 family endonuclease [Cyanobacteria bacterium P01_H01_bin.121]